MADITQSAHILIGYLIGNKSSQIPQKAIGFILTADNIAIHYGDIGYRIITVLLFKLFYEIVCPILTAHFIAILNSHLERFPIGWRNPSHNFAQESIKMLNDMEVIHFIDL